MGLRPGYFNFRESIVGGKRVGKQSHLYSRTGSLGDHVLH